MATRTCIGCRRRAPDHELIRVTQLDGRPAIGVRGRGGRGAWLHRNAACVAAAGERRAFSRALRTRLADDDFAATLLRWLADQRQS